MKETTELFLIKARDVDEPRWFTLGCVFDTEKEARDQISNLESQLNNQYSYQCYKQTTNIVDDVKTTTMEIV